ncbi:MAG TPA: arylesterase [Blastocatellia bacterium]|nr:arylesterase [Blastocatellia bacterium]
MLGAFAACKGGPSKGAGTAPSASDSPSKPVKSVAKIVAFGDSLTAGYGLSREQSYPSLLQKKLAAEGFDYDVVNAGINGDTSAGGVRRIDWSLEGGDVKIVILELGANDILRGQPISEMKKNLSTIIERAQARGAQVLLAGMEAPTNSGIDYRRWTHGAFTELAKEHDVPFIPFLLDRVAGVQSLNQPDGIHPNAEGARIVADTVYQYLKPMLEKQ